MLLNLAKGKPKTRIDLIQLIQRARRKQDYWETIEYEVKELKRLKYREVADELEVLRKQRNDEIAKNKALQERVDAHTVIVGGGSGQGAEGKSKQDCPRTIP